MGSIFLHLVSKMAKMRFFKTIFDGKMPFPRQFLGLQLLGACLPSLTNTQVTGMRLFDQNVEMGAIFLHLVPKMAKIRFFKTIFDGNMPFPRQFLGLQLPGACLPILDQYPGNWNTLIRPKCGNGSHIFTFGT